MENFDFPTRISNAFTELKSDVMKRAEDIKSMPNDMATIYLQIFTQQLGAKLPDYEMLSRRFRECNCSHDKVFLLGICAMKDAYDDAVKFLTHLIQACSTIQNT